MRVDRAFDVTRMFEMHSGGLDGFHEAISNNTHGDWRIDGKSYFIPVKYILNYLDENPKKISNVPIKKICWKGQGITDKEDYVPTQRVVEADLSYPVIVAKGATNPQHKEYRMLDGAHRATKVEWEGGTHVSAYVLSNEEFLQLISDYESSRWDEDEHIELHSRQDFFGFPVCVYKFKKHDELKTKLLEELVDHDTSENRTYKNSTYIRTKPDGKPLLDAEEGSVLHEVKMAKQKAYNHFYREILAVDFTLDHRENNYNNKLIRVDRSEPKITQSWVVGVPPNPTDKFISKPMTNHAHFMSPVCGAYYANIDNDDPMRDGGNLIFTNPAFIDYQMGSMSYLLRECLRSQGSISYTETCYLREGYIVIWSGALYHTIQPFRNTPTDRISIITNSCPDPFFDSVRKYNYNITAYFPEDNALK